MKYYAYITRPEDFLANNRTGTLILRDSKDHAPDEWIYVQPVDIFLDENIDQDKLRSVAVEHLEFEIKRAREVYLKDLQDLESRRDNLLAIEHKPIEA